MAKAKEIQVSESLPVLKAELKKAGNRIRPRIQMLITIKKSDVLLTKYELAEAVGVNHNSVTKWRMQYIQGGLSALLTHHQGGRRKVVITPSVHKAIARRLHSSSDGFNSYRELQQWVEENYIRGIKYITLVKYVQQKFGAKLKVARKSNIQKDPEAVAAFKKNTGSASKTY